MYGSWDMEYNRQNFLPFWTIFFPFNSLTTRKIKILKNWKNNHEILSIYTCTIIDNHMKCGSWDMEQDRHNFLSFWAIFCSFTSLTRKIQILKKMKKRKKRLEILSFYMCNEKKEKNAWRYYHFTCVSWTIIISCMVSEIWRANDRIFCHFRPIFALLPL